jgi:uncharacterized damage-inducible protein DinB
MTTKTASASTESTVLLQNLARQRSFLRQTVRDLTDEQAALRTTASALCLGGLIKHVTQVEKNWTDFIVRGASSMEADEEGWDALFRMQECETLAGLLTEYEKVASETEKVVASLPDLEVSHPLPEAPWFEPGASWTARQVLLHMLAETAQHSGHADIIRESLDGAKTMG